MLILAQTLLFLPCCFQLWVGYKAIKDAITLEFGTVCILSIIFQFIASSVSLIIVPITNRPFCGIAAPIIEIIMLSMMATLALVIIMIVQKNIKPKY